MREITAGQHFLHSFILVYAFTTQMGSITLAFLLIFRIFPSIVVCRWFLPLFLLLLLLSFFCFWRRISNRHLACASHLQSVVLSLFYFRHMSFFNPSFLPLTHSLIFIHSPHSSSKTLSSEQILEWIFIEFSSFYAKMFLWTRKNSVECWLNGTCRQKLGKSPKSIIFARIFSIVDKKKMEFL